MSTISTARIASLLDAHAAFAPVELVPSLSAWWAEDELPVWQALEAELGRRVEPPFYAVPWPSGQLLARAVTEGVLDVRGKRVLDLGAGSGIASVASARAGARVVACDVDPIACSVAAALAERHGVTIELLCEDVLSRPDVGRDFDVVIAGDLVYSAPQVARVGRMVERLRGVGVEVALADGGSPFFTPFGLEERLRATVRVPRWADPAGTRTARLFA